MRRWGSSTGKGAGWPTRLALSGAISQMSVVASMNSSRNMVALEGSPCSWRWRAVRARSKRPLLAMTTRSVRSRRTGLPGRWNDPHAQEPPAPRPFHQMTSPRSSRRRRFWRMSMTSADRERYGRRPRLATLTAMRPPGSSLSTHSPEHRGEHLQVGLVGLGDVVGAQGGLVLLAGEVGGRGHHQGHGGVVDGGHGPGVAGDEDVDGLAAGTEGLVGRHHRRGEAVVEGRGRHGPRAGPPRSWMWRWTAGAGAGPSGSGRGTTEPVMGSPSRGSGRSSRPSGPERM